MDIQVPPKVQEIIDKIAAQPRYVLYGSGLIILGVILIIVGIIML